MDKFEKKYVEWQKCCRLINEDAGIRKFFTFLWFIVSGILIVASSLEFGLWGTIASILLVILLTLYLRPKVRESKSSMYKDVLGNYIMLVTEINENLSEAFDKGYNKIFFEYEKFIGIKFGMNEFDIIKKFRSFPGSKKLWNKTDFEEIALEHVKTRALLEEERLKRQAECLKKIM